MVAAGIAEQVLVQVAYAIGVAEPVGLYVNTYGTAKVGMKDAAIGKIINEVFDMRPSMIVKRLGLKNPIFLETAAYGHMGRQCGMTNGFETFTWEKLDYVDSLKTAFSLS